MTPRLPVITAFALGVLAVLPLSAQQVTLDYSIFESDTPDTYFQLAGQSAYLQFRINSGTSGGQLDFTTGPSTGVIIYDEVFPPDNLADYQTFAYFGLVETRSSDDGSVIDTSFVMARTPTFVAQNLFPIGQSFQDFFPSYTEAQIVTALRDTFDSPEFIDMVNQVSGLPGGVGTIALPDLGRFGDTMDLVAFIGGNDGSEGVVIGSLGTTIVIPEATVPAFCALAAMGLWRRRRPCAI